MAFALQIGSASAESKWQFGLSPYVWIAGISGTVDTRASSSPPREIDVSFGDVFDNLSGIGLMLAGEARYGRFGLIGDLMWIKVEADFKTKGILFNGGHATTSVLQAGLVGLYRLARTGGVTVDAGAGMRLWALDLEGRLNSGTLPSAKADANKTWVDPIFAVRSMFQIDRRWSATLYGDIGGFGVSSDLTWQVIGTINYRAANWVDLRIGYRHMEVDRDKADIALSGPIVGATFKF